MTIRVYKRGLVSVLFVLAVAFLMISVDSPAHSGGCTSHPHGTTIDVISGDNFLLRYRLYWDDPEHDGMFGIALIWYNYENKPEENLTFLGVRVYWDNGQNISIDVPCLRIEPAGADTRYELEVKNTSYPNPNDGNFTVDIWLRASGVGGVPHVPTDNHPIFAPEWAWGAVNVVEEPISEPILGTDKPITIHVLSKVGVGISPQYQEGTLGSVLNYNVTVTNRSQIADNYVLTVSDDAGWGPTLSKNLLENVQPGENRVVTLSVTIPENAEHCTEDDITVTATSLIDNTVSNSASCIACAFVWTGTAAFKHENLYAVSLEKDLQLYAGSKLVVKFYTYRITFQAESVIDNFTPPENIKEKENVLHPLGMPVEFATLVLTTDNTANEISTLASFTATKSVIANNYLDLKRRYIQPGADKSAIAAEYLKKKAQYVKAPSDNLAHPC